MARKPALGKGLDALIPTGPQVRPGVFEISIDRIKRNPRQPRSQVSDDRLEDLAESIRQHGVLQPLLISSAGDEYQLIAGERRLVAAKLAGLQVVPAVVREASEQASLEMALVENLQRSDLNALEAAEGYRQLIDDFGLSHEEVAARVGKSRTAVTNTLRLLRLSAAVRQGLESGQISEGHARALLGLERAQQQAAAMRTIVSKGLNVRQAEALVRSLGDAPKPRAKPNRRNPEADDLAAQLEGELGTKVSIRPSKRGGQVVIYYYSDEELNAIADRLLSGETL